MSTTGGEWQAIHGWAEPVEQAQTPRTSFGVRLLSAPDGSGPAQLEAPAGALAAGQRLSVRFFHDGAKRVLLEVVAVAPGPAGPQLVQARPLAASEPAPQRRSERTALSVSVPARALECARLPAGERLELEVVNASAGGVLVRGALPLGYGDLVMLEPPGAPARLRIIRRDPRGPRIAGSFVDEREGEAAYRALLRLAEAG